MARIKITALIERNDNGFYAIMADSPVCKSYFAGYGYSVKEATEDFMECIKESLELSKSLGNEVTVKPEDIEVSFRYELQTFFHDFDWINVSAFAKAAGINESKMRAYKSGLCRASKKTLDKISKAVDTLGAQLNAASL